MARYENGIPILNQPKAPYAFGLCIPLDYETIAKLKEAVAAADAENKAEICIAYNQNLAFFTFESFLALIFPPESTGQAENPTNTKAPVI